MMQSQAKHWTKSFQRSPSQRIPNPINNFGRHANYRLIVSVCDAETHTHILHFLLSYTMVAMFSFCASTDGKWGGWEGRGWFVSNHLQHLKYNDNIKIRRCIGKQEEKSIHGIFVSVFFFCFCFYIVLIAFNKCDCRFSVFIWKMCGARNVLWWQTFKTLFVKNE